MTGAPMTRIPTHRAPTRPGEILREEFLEPLGMTQVELADRIGVSFQRVNGIVNGHRAVTADTALRLAALFDTTAAFWMNAQIAVDLSEARSRGAAALSKIRPMRRRGHGRPVEAERFS